MKTTKSIMGMPVTIEILGPVAPPQAVEQAIAYLRRVDRTFSTYKPTSEISRLNRGSLRLEQASADVRYVLDECERLKGVSGGHFDIISGGQMDPSGFVKGWAIRGASRILESYGILRYQVEIAGDMQVCGPGPTGGPWRIGIKNPLEPDKLAKVVYVKEGAVATSGTYERGTHIYNPHTGERVTQIVSLTVIGDDIARVDAAATAAYSMGGAGLAWLKLQGYEAMLVETGGMATFTDGFARFEQSP